MLLLILALNLQYSFLTAGIRNENHHTKLGNLLFLHITFDLSMYTNRQTYTSVPKNWLHNQSTKIHQHRVCQSLGFELFLCRNYTTDGVIPSAQGMS